ncbi:hypothetical protein TRFO_15837 [Tritrichomonas foetus]|uniref:DUF3447 domain-containing protein n=1 Tax=Tritrichomonas foetus TaxID=1144522 RepID=A0A1J4KRN7_9EUKA|nr:hypothetical protein TRFO_15837 [Tritrichomonas foetus]|eukprot:OHT13935.1 hypothetical protein TRFO_15837 [Tritrichomonas foetus]
MYEAKAAVNQPSFNFVVNNAKCEFNPFVAATISNKFRNYLNNFSNLVQNGKELNQEEINIINDIFTGKQIVFSKENIEFISFIAKHFEIVDLLNKAESYVHANNIKNQNLATNLLSIKNLVKYQNILSQLDTNNFDECLQILTEDINPETLVRMAFNICLNHPDKIEIIVKLMSLLPVFQKFIEFVLNVKLSSRINTISIILYYAQTHINPEKLNDYFKSKFQLRKYQQIYQEQQITFDPIAIILKNDDLHELMNQKEISIMMNHKIGIRTLFHFLHEKIGNYAIYPIEFAAALGSSQCFKFLLGNNAIYRKKNLEICSVIGGNPEIVKLCIEKGLAINDLCGEAIKYHQSDLFEFILENNEYDAHSITNYIRKCFKYSNYDCFERIIVSQNDITKFSNEIVKLALKFDNDLIFNQFFGSVENMDPNTLLLYSIKNKSETIFSNLLKIMEFDPVLILVEVVQHGNVKMLELILNNSKSNINANDQKGKSALQYACIRGDSDFVKIILNDPSIDINVHDYTTGETPLHLACLHNHAEIVKLLLEFEGNENGKVDVNKQTIISLFTPVHIACFIGNYDIVKMLLENTDIDVNIFDSKKRSALHHACLTFIQHRHKVNIENSKMKIVDMLLQKPDINYKGINNELSPLHCACYSGFTKIFDLLSKLQTEEWPLDNMKRNILHYSCMGNHYKMVKLIVDNRLIDINLQDLSGNTPLHLNIIFNRKRKFDTLDYLLENDQMKLNIKNKQVYFFLMRFIFLSDNTPLHLACMFCPQAVGFLVDREQNINVHSQNSIGILVNILSNTTSYCSRKERFKYNERTIIE